MMTAGSISDEAIKYHFQEAKKNLDKGQYPLAESSFEHTKRLLQCRLNAPLNATDRNDTQQAVAYVERCINECRKGAPVSTSPTAPLKMALHSTGEATVTESLPSARSGLSSLFPSDPSISREQALIEFNQELGRLVGLKELKKELATFANLIRFDSAVSKSKPSNHILITGNPGTGKTTVAMMISKYLFGIGYLEKGHFVTASKGQLCGEVIGAASCGTEGKFDEAQGGVLFIDEAHNLAVGGDKDFGLQAIATINQRMDTDRGKMVVIFAGYPDGIKELLNKDPGLKSRFNAVIHFPDYTPAELTAISRNLLTDGNLSAEPEFYVGAFLTCFMSPLTPTYDRQKEGNGRFVRERLLKLSRAQLANSEVPPNPDSPERWSRELRVNHIPFERLTGIPWSAIDRDLLQWELKRENGDVISMDADTVGQYFASMDDHRVLDEGQPELTPATREYLKALMDSVN